MATEQPTANVNFNPSEKEKIQLVQNRLAVLQEEVLQATIKVSTVDDEIKHKSKYIADLDTQIAEKEVALQSVTTQFESASVSLIDCLEELSKAQESTKIVKEEIAKEEEAIKAKEIKLEADITTLNQDKESFRSELAEFETKKKDVEKIAEAMSNIATLIKWK